MKNIDKIRAMSAEELANLICTKDTAICASCMAFKYCKSEQNKSNCCEFIIEQWLRQEDNPMPELKAGDLVIDKKGNVYLMDKSCCDKMEENHRPMTMDKNTVTRIDRV